MTFNQGGEMRSPVRPQPFAGAAYDVVAVAASAGGLMALGQILEPLPVQFPAAVVVVQHLDPRHRSLIAEILSKRTPLRVVQAGQGAQLAPSAVYIAPPDHHLLVNGDGTLSLTQSELVHFLRPSADLLFESVAGSYRDRAIAIVLSGTGSDGARGIQAIKETGGTTIVQEPQSAQFSGMPEAAIRTGAVDYILPLSEISRAIIALVITEESKM